VKILLAPVTGTPTFLRFMSTDTKKLNRSRNPMDLTFNDVEQLSRFITETGKILPRKDTGLSAKHQRRITKLIKQGRNMLTMQ
jgi:small subunit ribosomal protein S18